MPMLILICVFSHQLSVVNTEVMDIIIFMFFFVFQIKAKNQLRVNGITFMAYFGSYFIIFTSIMYLICSGILGLILLFNLPFLKDSAAVILLVVIISLYCPSSLIFSTCLSYVFDKAESALSILPNVSTFLGLIPFIIVTFLDVLQIGKFEICLLFNNILLRKTKQIIQLAHQNTHNIL